MESELLRQAVGLFGESVQRRPDAASAAPADGKTADSKPAAERESDAAPELVRVDLTSRQSSRVWRHVGSIDAFWEQLQEIEPGAVKRLAETATARRWEVIFLTKRPETAGATSQVQTQRWLQAHGFPLPSVFVVQGSRGRIAAALALDIVVDDRPENCLDVVVDSKARAILVWRDDKANTPAAAKRLGIGVVKTVGECLDILAQIDSPSAREQSGVMDRIMRLLGLKEPAGV